MLSARYNLNTSRNRHPEIQYGPICIHKNGDVQSSEPNAAFPDEIEQQNSRIPIRGSGDNNKTSSANGTELKPALHAAHRLGRQLPLVVQERPQDGSRAGHPPGEPDTLVPQRWSGPSSRTSTTRI